MKKIALTLLMAALPVVLSIQANAQSSDFSGKWKLDWSKSVISEGYPVLIRLDAQVRGDSLLTERTYSGDDGQEYPFTENLTLDGREHPITVYDMPRKSKAVRSETDGLLNIESTTTYYGESGSEDFISRETWKVDKSTKTLTISFKNSTPAGESTGSFLFNKAE